MTSESKLALVTGASRGIGAAIADSLGSIGLKVIGLHQNHQIYQTVIVSHCLN